MTALRALWQPGAWWPSWLGLSAGLFLLREVWALASGRPQDTLSYWVWRILAITQNEPLADWNATDYLVCGCWLVLVSWLTFHLFGRRFA